MDIYIYTYTHNLLPPRSYFLCESFPEVSPLPPQAEQLSKLPLPLSRHNSLSVCLFLDSKLYIGKLK